MTAVPLLVDDLGAADVATAVVVDVRLSGRTGGDASDGVRSWLSLFSSPTLILYIDTTSAR